MSHENPQIAVVIPHYEDPRRLRWLLAALANQDLDPNTFEVVVSDDGSATAPEIGATPFSCKVVRQPRRGFRAAAARNNGARATAAPTLIFLDGDTLPTPGYLRLLGRATTPGMLTVGRRRHADLSACTDDAVASFLAGTTTANRLEDPEWLAAGYRRTDNLRTASEEDFRFVISAVLGIDRALFERAGGFDETMVGYGGEDWDLAHRVRLLGGDWLHVPEAVAWHDGADFAARPDNRGIKDAESLALAARITLPSVRGRGIVHRQPDIVATVRGHRDDGEAYLTAQTLLADSDCGVWFRDRHSIPGALANDPRVRLGEPSQDLLDRCRFRLHLDEPVELGRSLRQLCAGPEIEVTGLLTIRRTRAINRGDEPPAARDHPDVRRARTAIRVEGRIGHDG